MIRKAGDPRVMLIWTWICENWPGQEATLVGRPALIECHRMGDAACFLRVMLAVAVRHA